MGAVAPFIMAGLSIGQTIVGAVQNNKASKQAEADAKAAKEKQDKLEAEAKAAAAEEVANTNKTSLRDQQRAGMLTASKSGRSGTILTGGIDLSSQKQNKKTLLGL